MENFFTVHENLLESKDNYHGFIQMNPGTKLKIEDCAIYDEIDGNRGQIALTETVVQLYHIKAAIFLLETGVDLEVFRLRI